VAVNQVALFPLGVLLKQRLGAEVTVIGLSHGSESGDGVHEVAGAPGHRPVRRRLAEWRLGRMLAVESRLFAQGIDLLLVMSEADAAIARWQGAERTLVVPRTWRPHSLADNWPSGVVGFLGSLHHAPNWDGLSAVLEAMAAAGVEGTEVRIIGNPPHLGERLARKHAFVRYLGPLRDSELAGAISQWSVFINPVFRHARGASTKLAMAIGWGIPIVSTHAGARGYPDCESSVIWADTPAEFATAALAVSRDAALRAESALRIGALARRPPRLCELAQRLGEALGDPPGAIDLIKRDEAAFAK
jgi:hypothetical protein